jgi:hypothetical protein
MASPAGFSAFSAERLVDDGCVASSVGVGVGSTGESVCGVAGVGCPLLPVVAAKAGDPSTKAIAAADVVSKYCGAVEHSLIRISPD